MLSERQIQQLVSIIHNEPELRGVRVGYYSLDSCYPGHIGDRNSPNYWSRVAIIEETTIPGVTIGEVFPSTPVTQAVPPVREIPTQQIRTNRSRVGAEMVGAGLSCGATAISALGVFGSAAAEIPSAGTSTFLLVVSWTGLLTAGTQCLNGLVRVGGALSDLDGNSLQRWDNNKIYEYTMLVVDGFGVASNLASIPNSTRNLIAVLQRHRALTQSAEALQAMTRVERLAAVRQAVVAASRNPATARAVEEELRPLSSLARRTGLRTAQAERYMVSYTGFPHRPIACFC